MRYFPKAPVLSGQELSPRGSGEPRHWQSVDTRLQSTHLTFLANIKPTQVPLPTLWSTLKFKVPNYFQKVTRQENKVKTLYIQYLIWSSNPLCTGKKKVIIILILRMKKIKLKSKWQLVKWNHNAIRQRKICGIKKKKNKKKLGIQRKNTGHSEGKKQDQHQTESKTMEQHN